VLLSEWGCYAIPEAMHSQCLGVFWVQLDVDVHNVRAHPINALWVKDPENMQATVTR
jgi:hypothetical protein